MQVYRVNCDIPGGTRIEDEKSALNAEMDFIFGEQFQYTKSTPQGTSTVHRTV